MLLSISMSRPTLEELATLYRSMDEAQLIELAQEYDRLTEVAQSTLRAEFAARKLEPPELRGPRPYLESQQLAVVGRYRDLPQAQMAKSLLESAGIECYLRDENTIRIEWQWSNLMGGIRLQVPVADQEIAEAILAQPIPESIAIEGESDYRQPRCPRCNSLDILHESTSQKVGVAYWLVLGFPVAMSKDEWKCHTCGAVWKDIAGGDEAI
jgi:hypothetical protein